ncbi:MAG: hypothetical protein WAL30_04870 [Candidatus Aquirickettsiella sp.]
MNTSFIPSVNVGSEHENKITHHISRNKFLGETDEAIFEFQLHLADEKISIIDYSSNLEDLIVLPNYDSSEKKYTFYECTFYTNQRLNKLKLPIVFGSIILDSYKQDYPLLSFTNFSTLYFRDKVKYPQKVNLNIITSIDGKFITTVSGDVYIKLLWKLK